LRGLHYQYPKPQGKLIRVVSGSIIDVVVDLRRSSKTFGRWASIKITSADDFQLWVPIGFAHGFLALDNNTLLTYKVTDFWSKDDEHTLLYNDPLLGIEWSDGSEFIVSKKDKKGVCLAELPFFD
jgi:dTDP-4-dehydrorhamnose 3,5-epimerase